ncbi:retrovirus-related pol polyprotein from transposon TNT 1-94 [Tanacetum coccineum]
MSRTMLNEQSLPQKFWCNIVDTSTYILNRILIKAILGKTTYELLRGRKPTLDYFRVFGSKCFILNTKDYLTKFDLKSYEGVILGYSQNTKAYIILNKHTRKFEESLNVTLDETLEIDEIVNIKESRNHPLENVIGNLNQRTLRLVAQGYNQQEGINYDETYAPVARLESIRILLAYDCALDFKLFQMDVKSAFLNGFINEEFEMSMMGELNFFLGLQIKQMEDGIFFNQSKYIKEMLKKFGLEDSKPMKTPMSSDTKLTKDEECESVDSTKYRGMIGSLLYLTASRPDIMFSVCLCARFQEAPKTSHLEAVKRIFRYIKGTTHLGLWYPKGTGIETVVYADSDHAGDYVDRKSTSGICTQYRLSYSDKGQMFVEFVIQSQFFSYSLEEFAQIINIPCEGACVFTDRWSLDELVYGSPSEGPYQTNLPSPDDIISYIREDREGQVTRIRHREEVEVQDY